MASITKHYCDKCNREIQEQHRLSNISLVNAFTIDLNMTVKGFRAPNGSTGYYQDEREVLFCRPCYAAFKKLVLHYIPLRLD